MDMRVRKAKRAYAESQSGNGLHRASFELHFGGGITIRKTLEGVRLGREEAEALLRVLRDFLEQ